MSTSQSPLRLFAGLGIELEYMIVDAESLSVRPIADELIRAECGAYESNVERGAMEWSNELALHVIELKTNGPVRSVAGINGKFQSEIVRINELLNKLGARLMPTAMHPWMDPHSETRLWPHDYNPVYEAFNRVFDCRGHGWSNLQSCHLNLPFGDNEEFARLHAAIRLVLPILPALAASSPVCDGRLTGFLDSRLEAYRRNCARIPSITGQVIPEPVFSPAEYQTQILERIYRDIAPFDPKGTLQDEWLNARGAIARFDRNTIEIRLLDVQECPSADVAIAATIQSAVRALVEEQWSSLSDQQSLSTNQLQTIFLATLKDADETAIGDSAFLRNFGLPDINSITARDLWRHLIEQTGITNSGASETTSAALNLFLDQGPLARRILRALGDNSPLQKIRDVYRRLCDCLARGELFSNHDR